MDLTWALEDVARTSDDAVVRRRFAERNRVWLTVLLLFFTFVSFLEVVANSRSKSMFEVLVGCANFALCAFLLFFLWRTRKHERLARWLAANTSATLITYVIVQYLLLLVFAGDDRDWVAWAMTMPFFMLGLRMPVAELVLLHGFFLATNFVTSFIAPMPGTDRFPFYIAFVALNALTCGTELYMSRRMRRSVVGEWSVRRTSAREQIRMRDELRYARELQLSMLPECAPQLDWADICSISVPATEVGGDYYDYFVEDRHIALVCGDVAGHGMASGLVLAALRSGFTLLRESLHDPAAVLRRLHDLVAQTSRRRMLVTVSVALVGPNQATIASAGHPPVILRRADGTVRTIDLYAPPLGVRLPVNIPQQTIDLAPGDVLVLHSDGIYETRSPAGEDYGLDRLAEVVRLHGSGTAEQLRDAMLADVSSFRETPEASDDITIVVCRMK
ncbi:MAG TPA: PP2C family protein-serine/threonine phosphatase [Thermoanaerobaculia bacterium]